MERLVDVLQGWPALSAGLAEARAKRAARVTAQTADAARVTALVERDGEALLAYFARRVQPREDAADLLSETFTVLWRRSRDLPEGDEAGRMWVYGIARNVLSTHRRGQGRRSALVEQLRAELDAAATSTLGGAASAPCPDAEYAAQLVRGLPTPDREIVMLLHWDGFTLNEIAQLLDLPAGTVRSRYARARGVLKKQLEAASE